MDSALAHPSKFSYLLKKANITHVRHSYGLSKETEDSLIYQIATAEERFVVTLDSDFKKLVSKNKAGVILVPPYLSTEKMDRLLYKFVSGKNPDDYNGKAIKIPDE